MEKLLIDKLVENKWACPFDNNTLEILISNEESRGLIENFSALCDSINYQFSNPGNSFGRKLINILNRKYQLDSLNNPCSVRNKCEESIELLSTYDNLIEELRTHARKTKFRRFKDVHFNFSVVTENDITSYFASDVLNNLGIITTYNTFIDKDKATLNISH
jgi:hypothetical protein